MAGLPTQFEIMHLINFAPETGAMTWLERPASMFVNGAHSAEHQAAKWNAAHAGRTAVSVAINGYGYTTINGRKHLSHRLAWKLAFNTEPSEIDHVNGNRTDNRLANLRSVDRQANMRNMKRSKRNTSGATGVSYRADRGVWRAYVHVDGRIKSLGHFATIDEAKAAREKASEDAGYHANHGR